MKRIKIVGCGESFRNLLDSHLLDDLDVELVINHTQDINNTDADVVFIVWEIGDDPGAWHIPALASSAADQGIFSIVLAHTTLPHHLMGEHTMSCVSKLQENSDLFVFLPFNQIIPQYSISESPHLFVHILERVIRDLSNLIRCKGLKGEESFLNDNYILESIRESNDARVGLGVAYWEDDYVESVENALKCPLLGFDLKEARMVFVTVTGDLNLHEVERMLFIVADESNDETDVLWDFFPDYENNKIKTFIMAFKGEIPGTGLMKWINESF